jgi:hypothetical protein
MHRQLAACLVLAVFSSISVLGSATNTTIRIIASNLTSGN